MATIAAISSHFADAAFLKRVQPCSLYYETRLSLSVFKRLLSLLASIVLTTFPLADETLLNSKREGPKIGLEDDVQN